ncbi:hypothetical protein SAMN05421869_11330 [Nonomuraea jiangxiensis]|uniref:Uncharacterized protein n=1 Tax=Nonomuraea jiangxiensis TaxID=633440 RepID=A0A1G8XP16_9ACTN|nr:hypothetical protein SAMN05421869_11330 [Nonomuraea jiangxiensis]
MRPGADPRRAAAPNACRAAAPLVTDRSESCMKDDVIVTDPVKSRMRNNVNVRRVTAPAVIIERRRA